MKKVEILRTAKECHWCMDMAIKYDGSIPDCTGCKKLTGTWIDTIKRPWGTYALVQIGDIIKKIHINGIKVIDTEEKNITLFDEMKQSNQHDLAEIITCIYSCDKCREVHMMINGVCEYYRECVDVAEKKLSWEYEKTERE